MPNGTQLLLPVRTKQLECERRLPYDIVQAHKEQDTSAYLQTRISSSRTIHKLFFHSIIINYDGIDYFNEIYKINNDKLIVE